MDPRAAARWVGALLLLLATACAHGGGPQLRRDSAPTCDQGSGAACVKEGEGALAQGDKARAADRFGLSCELGNHESCARAGRLKLELGDLDGAEGPLEEAADAKLPAGYYGLADLYQARGDRQSLLAARRLRWEALALEQPDAEVIGEYRLGTPAFDERWVTPGYAVSSFVLEARVQPMAFYARRVAIGAQATFGLDGTELMYLMGYQHFFREWLILYADALAGARFRRDGLAATYDFGAQAGLKFAWGPVGHINVGVGSTLGSPLHFQVGVGLDWLLALAVLAAGL